MATLRLSAAAKPQVSALLSEELLPKNPNAVSFLGELRRVLFNSSSDFECALHGVVDRLHRYEISDDQTVLDLKTAVIEDPVTRAGRLKPQALRVCQLQDDTGAWDPLLIRSRVDGKVVIECADAQTIAECKRGATDISFRVDITPSGWKHYSERYELYCSTHSWPTLLWCLVAIFFVVKIVV